MPSRLLWRRLRRWLNPCQIGEQLFRGGVPLPPIAFMCDSLVRGGRYSKFKVEPGHKYFINVGSVGEPRDGSPLATYVIYDLADGSIELRRIPYDVAQTEAKSREAGLPLRRKQLACPQYG